MAARQLPTDRRADRHGQEALSAWLQPGVAAPRTRSVEGSAARLRHRSGDDRARRWPGRCRESEPFRGRLPDRCRAPVRRAMGHPDHAAARPDRESPPRRRATGDGQGRARPGQCLGRSDDGDCRKGSQKPDPCDRRHGAINPPDGQRVCRGVCAPSAGTESGACPGVDMDRTAARGIASDDRTIGTGGKPATSCGSGFDQQ